MTDSKPQVTIFCDGGSQPNPGPGGWGALLIYEGEDGKPREVELSGAHPDTTNNQMELTAACSALEALDGPHAVTMYVDSQYVRNGITKWIAGWIEKDWVTSSGDPVKNQDLWERLDSAVKRHSITWRWVRGHAGNPNNERVDQLATHARRTLTGETAEPLPEKKPAKPAVEPKNDIKLYVSGQFSWDVKAGGWGALVIDKDGTRRELGGPLREDSAGNRVFLLAAIKALEAIAETPGSVDVFTDQEYLQKGMSEWLDGWIKKGWRTAGNKEVKNQDLWERLSTLAKGRTIAWHQVRASDMNLQEASMAAGRKIRW